MPKPVQMMPSVLPQRPSVKTRTYTKRTGNVTSLESVEVDVTTKQSGHTYSAPELQGEAFDRMRNYGTVLAHWSLEDRARYAKRWKLDMSNVNAACRIVSNEMYTQVFGDDPSADTVNVRPYISALDNPANITPALVASILSFYGTSAFDEIVSGTKNTDIADELRMWGNDYIDWHKKYYFAHVNGLHADAKSRERKRAIAFYKDLSNLMERASKTVTKSAQGQVADAKRKQSGQGIKPAAGAASKATTALVQTAQNVREIFTGSQGWARAFVHKPPLEVPHTGLMGRRRIASNEGKYPKYFSRIVTDPYKRIFDRKTRALGGVVVIDCSGSMSLDESDVRQLISSSAGCTVICYSASGDDADDAKNGNIHLIARNGRMARHLPYFPGGNGVDVPALEFGLTYKRSGNPLVWISDERVTGASERQTQDIVTQAKRFVAKHDVIVLPNVREAVKVLKRLQQGRKK